MDRRRPSRTAFLRGLGSVCAPTPGSRLSQTENKGTLGSSSQACILAAGQPAPAIRPVDTVVLGAGLSFPGCWLDVVSAFCACTWQPSQVPTDSVPQHLPSRPCSAQQHLLIAKLSAGWNQTKVFYGRNLI